MKDMPMRISGLIAVVLFFSSLYIHLCCDVNDNVQQTVESMSDVHEVVIFEEETIIQSSLGV